MHTVSCCGGLSLVRYMLQSPREGKLEEQEIRADTIEGLLDTNRTCNDVETNIWCISCEH